MVINNTKAVAHNIHAVSPELNTYPIEGRIEDLGLGGEELGLC